MKNKYIIIKEGSIEMPILFPGLLNHIDVARGTGKEAVGAGFWDIDTNNPDKIEYFAYGESITLGIKSREQDSEILNRFFNSYL